MADEEVYPIVFIHNGVERVFVQDGREFDGYAFAEFLQEDAYLRCGEWEFRSVIYDDWYDLNEPNFERHWREFIDADPHLCTVRLSTTRPVFRGFAQQGTSTVFFCRTKTGCYMTRDPVTFEGGRSVLRWALNREVPIVSWAGSPNPVRMEECCIAGVTGGNTTTIAAVVNGVTYSKKVTRRFRGCQVWYHVPFSGQLRGTVLFGKNSCESIILTRVHRQSTPGGAQPATAQPRPGGGSPVPAAGGGGGGINVAPAAGGCNGGNNVVPAAGGGEGGNNVVPAAGGGGGADAVHAGNRVDEDVRRAKGLLDESLAAYKTIYKTFGARVSLELVEGTLKRLYLAVVHHNAESVLIKTRTFTGPRGREIHCVEIVRDFLNGYYRLFAYDADAKVQNLAWGYVGLLVMATERLDDSPLRLDLMATLFSKLGTLRQGSPGRDKWSLSLDNQQSVTLSKKACYDIVFGWRAELNKPRSRR